MGSSASKANRAAAGTAARKYPSRPSPSTRSPFSVPPSPERASRPSPHASSTRSEAINLDATDPVYASNLRQIGVVQPNHFFPNQHSITPHGPSYKTRQLPSYVQPDPPNLPQFFPDLHSNPALRILQARQQLQDEAERELAMLGRRGFEGRRFLRSGEIRDVLALREAGVGEEEIERRMGLRKGVVRVLASRGIVENVV